MRSFAGSAPARPVEQFPPESDLFPALLCLPQHRSDLHVQHIEIEFPTYPECFCQNRETESPGLFVSIDQICFAKLVTKAGPFGCRLKSQKTIVIGNDCPTNSRPLK